MAFCTPGATLAAPASLSSVEETVEAISPSRESWLWWVLATAAGAVKESQATATAPAMSTGRNGRSADQDNAVLAMLDTPRLTNNLTIFYSVCLVERQSPVLEEDKSIESTGRFPSVVAERTRNGIMEARQLSNNAVLNGKLSAH